jgi:hypothetical protein
MALVRMQKVRLIGHDSVREAVMAVLQDLGVLQIVDLTGRDPGPEGAFLRAKRAKLEELEQKLNELKYVLDFIARFEPKAGLLESFTSPRPRSRSRSSSGSSRGMTISPSMSGQGPWTLSRPSSAPRSLGSRPSERSSSPGPR